MNYTITEEQIKEIALGNDKIKEMFPEVFEIKNNTWYIYPNGAIQYNEKDGVGYGIHTLGYIIDAQWLTNECNGEYREATDEEVEAALIKEAERRYGYNWKNVKIKEHADGEKWGCMGINNGGFNSYVYFGPDYSILYSRNGVLFNNGVWAEILEEPKEIVLDKSGTKELDNHLIDSFRYAAFNLIKADCKIKKVKHEKYRNSITVFKDYERQLEIKNITVNGVEYKQLKNQNK
jgi:hypothetical protein